MQNRYSGICVECGDRVEAGMGIAFKDGGRWKVAHHPGTCVIEDPWEGVNFDPYQQAVIDSLAAGKEGKHISVNAKPGSGKTTVETFSIVNAIKSASATPLKCICIAFGNEDGKRMRKKLRNAAEGLTTHSLGRSMVSRRWRGSKLNKRKDFELVEACVVLPDEKETSLMREWVMEIIAKIKADAVDPEDAEGFKAVIESYELDIPPAYEEQGIKLAMECVQVGMDIMAWGYNFDDMVYLPAVCNLVFPVYDIVGVDEVQDFNRAQLIIVQKLIATGARVIAVGDPRQSLYLFRGARHNSFELIRNALAETDKGVEDLPMPICYRCCTAVIERLQRLVPDIQARPGAPEGLVDLSLNITEMVEMVGAGDLVISRTNRPLIQFARVCNVLGKKFYLRGGMQEANLIIWLIKLLTEKTGEPTEDIGELLNRLGDWMKERAQRCSPYRMIDHAGRAEVIKLTSERCMNVKELIDEVKRLFSPPKNPEECIIISTIHRAKGSEADRVFHIRPQDCPHPKASTPEQLIQEENAVIVAESRAAEAYYECIGEVAQISVA